MLAGLLRHFHLAREGNHKKKVCKSLCPPPPHGYRQRHWVHPPIYFFLPRSVTPWRELSHAHNNPDAIVTIIFLLNYLHKGIIIISKSRNPVGCTWMSTTWCRGSLRVNSFLCTFPMLLLFECMKISSLITSHLKVLQHFSLWKDEEKVDWFGRRPRPVSSMACNWSLAGISPYCPWSYFISQFGLFWRKSSGTYLFY